MPITFDQVEARGKTLLFCFKWWNLFNRPHSQIIATHAESKWRQGVLFKSIRTWSTENGKSTCRERMLIAATLLHEPREALPASCIGTTLVPSASPGSAAKESVFRKDFCGEVPNRCFFDFIFQPVPFNTLSLQMITSTNALPPLDVHEDLGKSLWGTSKAKRFRHPSGFEEVFRFLFL